MAKLQVPESPVLLKDVVPPKFRPLAFLGFFVLGGFLVFFIVGLVGVDFEWALLAGLVAAPVIAYVMAGAPVTRAQLAKLRQRVPKAPPDKRPFLFFPAAIIAAALLYIGLGFALTSTDLDADALALIALGASLPAAIVLAYVLYGFPKPKGGLRGLKSPLERVPPDKRPLLFFPLGLLFAAPIYFVIGYAVTELIDSDLAVFPALVAGLALGFLLAYRLVGAPKPRAMLSKVKVPEVPRDARAPAFIAFVLIVGALIAVALGGTIGAAIDAPLLADLAFPLFLLAGMLLAVPLAGRLFGYPVPERPVREYLPRLTREQRPAALLPLTMGLGLLFLFLLGIAVGESPFTDLADAFLLAGVAFPLGFLVAMLALRVPVREVDPRALARAPERARPLVVLAVGLFAGTVLFAALGQVLTTFIVDAAVSYALGLALALLLVDAPSLQARRQRRAELRRREREVEARLRIELGLEVASAPSGGGRFRRRRGKA